MGNPQHITLTPNTVTTVTLDRNYDRVEVVNRDGSAEVYFTVNGTVPTIGGNGCQVLPAAISGLDVSSRPPLSPDAGPVGAEKVQLISMGSPKVTVGGL